jgi:hypothetical protein
METRYYFGKKLKLRVETEVKEDGGLYVNCYNLDGSLNRNVGAVIGSLGGVAAFLEKTISKDEFEKRLSAWYEENSPERVKERIMREAKRRVIVNATCRTEYYELLEKGLPIETNYVNIGVVLRWLNTMNWGAWELPLMSIGYKCNQYDCDGKQASTMVIDEPIEVCGEMVDRFVVGAPRGHLSKYYRC